MAGATTFPRHWVYDDAGDVVSKSATISFEEWYERGPGTKATPWGDEDSPVFTTMAETALERELSADAHAARPARRPRAGRGTVLTQQGDEADELFVILDGMVSVEVDGRDLGDLGPGRSSGSGPSSRADAAPPPLRALTPVRVAAASASAVSLHALRELTTQHHREDADTHRRRVRRRLLLLLAGAMLAAGCRLELDVHVEVAEDGSGSVEVVVGIDRDGIERIGGDLGAVLAIDDLEAAGWTVEGPDEEAGRLHPRAVPQALRRPGGGRGDLRRDRRRGRAVPGLRASPTTRRSRAPSGASPAGSTSAAGSRPSATRSSPPSSTASPSGQTSRRSRRSSASRSSRRHPGRASACSCPAR